MREKIYIYFYNKIGSRSMYNISVCMCIINNNDDDTVCKDHSIAVTFV